MTRRVAIIGMNSPYGPSPEHALWPDPPGCAGWHLWKMTQARTGATQSDYLRAFHRYNLVSGPVWSMILARRRWEAISADLADNFDTLVLLGAAVRRATGSVIPEILITRPLVCLPHPSGLNRWYNSDVNRRMVEVVMEELYFEAVCE